MHVSPQKIRGKTAVLELQQYNHAIVALHASDAAESDSNFKPTDTPISEALQHIRNRSSKYLYLSGSCFRMRRTEEMAYSPVSSVSTITKLVVLPAPETAKKNCKQ